MDNLWIRQALAADIDNLCALIFEHGPNPWNHLPPAEVTAHLQQIAEGSVSALLAERGGELLGFVEVFHDITEQKQREERLYQRATRDALAKLDALAKGAKLACGGKADTTLMPATVLDHVTPAMRIYHEETFGPVKCVVRVNGVEEAIACANDNEYGLSSAVFGGDIARAFNVARKIDSGICHVNGPTVHDEAQMPFGGVKGSGYGRFGGHAGINEFTEIHWVTVEDPNQHYPF